MHSKSSDELVSNFARLSDVIGVRSANESSQNSRWDNNDNRNCLVRVAESGHPVSVLTYRHALLALDQHRGWLQRLLDNSLEKNKQEELSFAKQTVIAYMAGNSADFFLSVLACSDFTSLGQNNDQEGVVVTALLNIRWSATEMARVLQTSDCMDQTVILYGPSFRSKATDLVQILLRKQDSSFVCCKPIPEFTTQYITSSNGSLLCDTTYRSESGGLDSSKEIQRRSPESHYLERDAIILFTSGTTSGPKGVRLSHKALLIQILAKIGPPCNISCQTRMLASTLSFYHVGGLTNLLAVWMAGGMLVFRNDRHRQIANGFDPPFVLRTMDVGNHPYDCNTLVLVPAMIHMIQQVAGSSSKVLPNVRLVLIGGQSAPPSALQFLKLHFPNTVVVQTYACTEGASSLTYLELFTANNPTAEISSSARESQLLLGDCVGKPPPHVEIALLGTEGEDNHDSKGNMTAKKRIYFQEPFQVGLIATRGPHVMKGYWNRATPIPLQQIHQTQLDWFVSNDLGFWDNDGNLFFCGRSSDTIRTGGETVLAFEVEHVLQQNETVDEVAVFPIQDIRMGEQVACAIVKSSNYQGHWSLKQAQDWCREHGLASYKSPRSLFWVSSLPRNSSGKVMKSELKRLFENKNMSENIRSKL